MDAMLLLVMVVLAWITLQSGMVFITLVIVALMLIMLMGDGGSSAPSKSGGGSGSGGQQPIIIQTGKGSEWPKKTNWQFRPDWGGDKDGEEYMGKDFAVPVMLVGKILKSFFLMLKPKESSK